MLSPIEEPARARQACRLVIFRQRKRPGAQQHGFTPLQMGCEPQATRRHFLSLAAGSSSGPRKQWLATHYSAYVFPQPPRHSLARAHSPALSSLAECEDLFQGRSNYGPGRQLLCPCRPILADAARCAAPQGERPVRRLRWSRHRPCQFERSVGSIGSVPPLNVGCLRRPT